MAESHRDNDASEFLNSLKLKADGMMRRRESEITAGTPVLAEWIVGLMGVRKLPDDEHGLLRISVGGGNTPINVDYCVFRGDREACIRLLRQAVKALESAPGDPTET